MAIKSWNEIPLEGVKGILLDLDNTIYEYEPVHRLAFDACMDLAEKKFEIPTDVFKSLWKSARDRVHNDLHGHGASHSRILYLMKLTEMHFGRTCCRIAIELEETYWLTFLENMVWRDGAREFLEKAHKSGIQIAIVTDLTTKIQLRKFEVMNLDRYIRYLVSSEEAGIEKPSARIFELAMEKLKMNADELIMIGDSIEKDIKGAEALKIKSYLIDDSIH